jgi:anti-sigma regulatory factor (Ser/Thr protein kinase)
MVREPQAAGAARRELQALLGELDDLEFDLIALLMTELIANSVLHAGPRAGGLLTLDVRITDTSARVTVTDGGRGFVPRARGDQEPTDGHWGLQLVEELADHWGVDTGKGTAVWFELDRAVAAPPTRRPSGERPVARRA